MYLSVLFKEFINQKISNVFLSPYGVETTEEVTKNWNVLASGQWLKQTKVDKTFDFKAIATVGEGIFEKRFKLDLADYAGENIEKFEDEKLLHKSKYFRYIIDSDVIFIAIDGLEALNSIISKDKNEILTTENALIAALNLIKQEKNVPLGRKLKTPIGIIIMKSDLIRDYLMKNEEVSSSFAKLEKGARIEKFIDGLYRDLIEYCTLNCLNLEIFYVSSVGHLTEEGDHLKH